MAFTRNRFQEEILPIHRENDVSQQNHPCPPHPKPCNGNAGAALRSALTYPYHLHQLVQQQSGDMPCRVRDVISGGGHYWSDHKGDDNHHNYVTINSVGRAPSGAENCPYKVANALKNNMESVFPGGSVGLGGQGRDGQPIANPRVVTEGNHFSLAAGPTSALIEGFYNPSVVESLPYQSARPNSPALVPLTHDQARREGPQVQVDQTTDYDFTLATVPGKHPLQGTAIHGVFRDCTGELWMFQEGTGHPTSAQLAAERQHLGNSMYDTRESMLLRGTNNVGANLMWQNMAGNFRQSQGYSFVPDDVSPADLDALRGRD